MMSQFFQNLVDTDPWNLSGHCPSSLQQTWGESSGFTAPDLDRRGGHFLDRVQSMSGHCPSQSTSGHCPSQGYSFYPTESSPGHIPCGFGSTQSATAIEAVSPSYQQIYSDITSREALSQWTFQSSQGTQMEQPDVYHNTQFSLPQQSSPCNIHFQHGLQQNTYHPNVRNLLSNWKDEIYNSTQLPKYLSFDLSKSKWSDFYRKFQQYADDKHWSSQECKSNLKYVLHGKAADYMAYLNELVPDLTYYDFIMQMKKYMESQDLFDSQFEQWHRQRTFGNNTDCSCTSIPNSHDCTQTMGIQPQSSFQERHWQSQEQFIGYRGYQHDSYFPFDCSGSNAMVHGPFQKIEMLSTGGPAQEMTCAENISCGSLDTKEQFTSIQVPPVAVQNEEPHRMPIGRGRGVLHQGSSHDKLSSKHQIELEEICLPSKTKIDEGLKSEKRNAENMEEGLVSLKSKSKKSPSQPQSYQPIRESRPPQRERYRYMGSMASHQSAGSPKESKTKGTEEQLADIEKTLKLLVEAMAIKPLAGGNFRSRTPSPSTAGAQGGRSLSPERFLQCNEEDLVFDTARSHHEGIVPRCKQTLSSEDEASGEQNGEGSKGDPQGILWMTEEVNSRIPGLNPSDFNKANDQNSFILGDTDDWSLDQTEVNTNISSLLPFPEEGKDIQMSVEELEELLWPEPKELQLVQGDSMGIHPEIQVSKSEIIDFWWDSMGPTELGSRDEKESPENCEDYIDFMYDSLFGTSPLNKEIPSTLHEDEEWIDKTFKEMQIQGYSAWNPFMSLEGEMISVQLDRTTGDFPIGQINPPSASSLRVPITLQDRSMKAIIDTAAMVTVISDQIYNEMKPNPPCLKATILQIARRNMKMAGRIIGPVSIKLGNVIFPTLVHVAPINNDMLLGLDFLLRIGAGINLKERHLVFTGATEIVPLEIDCENKASHTISKITAEEVEQIPAIIYKLQERSCHNLHPDEIYLPHTSYERPQKNTYCHERLDYPYLFNNQGVFGHADQGMVVSPVTMLKGISVLSTSQLETETKRRPELNYICYRQEIALMTIMKCIQGQQGLYQSKCLVKPKLSVLWFVEDERQWPWDPGGC